MTSIIAVTRVRNEDDIIESFVRHHATLADRFIILDNSSDDRTVEVLKSLRSEGFPITLFQCDSVAFAESAHNTFLARQAASLGADWVLCLDSDEFVDQRRFGNDLRAYLSLLPRAQGHVHAGMLNYNCTVEDDPNELIVPNRILFREKTICSHKVFIRSALLLAGAVVAYGNHDVFVDSATLPILYDPNLLLAHYPTRSGWQLLVDNT